MRSLLPLVYQLTLAHDQDPFANNAQEVRAPRDAAIDDSIAKNIAVVVKYIAVDHISTSPSSCACIARKAQTLDFGKALAN